MSLKEAGAALFPGLGHGCWGRCALPKREGAAASATSFDARKEGQDPAREARGKEPLSELGGAGIDS